MTRSDALILREQIRCAIESGCPKTLTAVAKAVDCSKSTAYGHLIALGVISKGEPKVRPELFDPARVAAARDARVITTERTASELPTILYTPEPTPMLSTEATPPLFTPPAPPAPTGIAGLLSQAASDLQRLEAERDHLRSSLAQAQTALAASESRPSLTAPAESKPAAEVPAEDCKHVPAPIPNWTPLDIEPACRYLAQQGIPLALVGPPGCGKSDLPKQVAAALGRPYIRLSCSDGATEGRILGRRDVRDGATTWTEGPLPLAFKKGWHLTLDELGAAPAGVLACAHDALASGTFHQPETGETIQAAPGTWITATSNYLGSDRNDASHEQPISAALADRFVVFACDYLSPGEETAILCRRLGLPAAAIPNYPELTPEASSRHASIPKKVAGLFQDLRAAEKAGDLSGPYSRRRAIQLCELLQAWGGTDAGQRLAIRGALLDRHPPSQRAIVSGLVQRHLGIAP